MPTMMLPCKMTEAEALSKSRELAAKVRECNEAEQKKRDAAAEAAATIKALDSEIGRLSREISDNTELREVEVIEETDFGKGVIETFRTDTNEVVSVRAIPLSERQEKLKLIPKQLEKVLVAELNTAKK